MDTEVLYDRSTTLADAEDWLALGTGALLLLIGASRRSAVGTCLAVSSAPLLYRGITGRWPAVVDSYLLSKKDYLVRRDGKLAAQAIQRIVDALATNGFIGERFDVARYIDLSYLPQ